MDIQRANVISVATGAVLGGPVIETHDGGHVTINFAGFVPVRGRSLTLAEVMDVEAGKWTGEPKLKTQRVVVE